MIQVDGKNDDAKAQLAQLKDPSGCINAALIHLPLFHFLFLTSFVLAILSFLPSQEFGYCEMIHLC